MNDVYSWVASFLIIFWDSFLRGGGVLGNGMLGMQMDNTNVLFCFVLSFGCIVLWESIHIFVYPSNSAACCCIRIPAASVIRFWPFFLVDGRWSEVL